jgi:2-keto-4-pentenoate hydratase/2-oxohepta-3-ene-1,7-dioic acid hydratase in catechol pathway
MKVAKITRDGQVASAIVDGPVAKVVSPWIATDPLDAPFTLPTLSLADLGLLASRASELVPLDEVTLLPPIGPRSKLVCIGLNYRDHVTETSFQIPPQPGLFTKFTDALVGHTAPLIRPVVSECFDFEGEIAVVIGKAGRNIATEHAARHVFGYTIMMDGSLRDYQGHSLSAGKNFWRSGSLGPWVVTADDVPSPTDMKITTRLNGEVVQSGTADMMIYDIPTVISYISRFTLLEPGDVISTGTPAGVGAMRKPPLWMRSGDRIEIQVSGVGTLRNPIEDAR